MVEHLDRAVAGPFIAPAPGLQLPQDAYQRQRTWAYWTSETVTEAILTYAEGGTFFALLEFFASKRRSLAVAYRSHDANLFGVLRNEHLAPMLRTRTTFFGPACPPYDKVVQAYESLLGLAPGSDFSGTVRARMGRDTYVLTSYKCDQASSDPRAKVWLHSHWRTVQPVLQHCRSLFEIALEPISDAAAWHTIAELHWWFVHALPYVRGTTSLGEWLVTYIFRMRGAGGVRFYDDPAAVAWVSPSVDIYASLFRNNVELVAASKPTVYTHVPARQLAHRARTGQLRGVRAMLQSVAASAPEPTGYTALHLACREGHLRVAKTLLAAGAPVNVELAVSRETPLHLAARAGHAGVVRLLLSHGAQVGASDSIGATALHWAAREGHRWVTWLLMRAHAPLGVTDHLGRTPLHYAAERGWLGLVKALTTSTAGLAILNGVDRRSETALSLAALQGHAKVVRLLLNRGATAPQQDAHLLAIKLGRRDAALPAGVDTHLYGLLARVAERGHGRVAALLRKALLTSVPSGERRNIVALLPKVVSAPRSTEPTTAEGDVSTPTEAGTGPSATV